MTRLQETTPTSPGSTINPVGQPVDAGPWRLTLTEARLGDAAASLVASANTGNEEPDEGLVYVAGYLTAENTSDQIRVINISDFAATSTDGILRRTPALVSPDPALQASVAPGEITEGWVPLVVNNVDNALIWFSSPFLGGDWSQAWFALTDGASIPAFGSAPEDSRLGISADQPATFGETVRAGDFDVTILEHVSGQTVYDMAQFGLRALGGDISAWHAVRVRATNVSDRPAFFSFTALHIADAAGEAWDHILALTAPIPDVAREILPGATREGWAAFNVEPWASLDLIRVQPSIVADEPRFVRFGGTPSASTTTETNSTSGSAPAFAEGDEVALTDDRINLRTDASASAGIVEELPNGTSLTITGESVEADGYTWYPVVVNETEQAGYVVADFLELAGGE